MRHKGPTIVADAAIPHEVNLGMLDGFKLGPKAFGVERSQDGDKLIISWKDSKYTFWLERES